MSESKPSGAHAFGDSGLSCSDWGNDLTRSKGVRTSRYSALELGQHCFLHAFSRMTYSVVVVVASITETATRQSS